jgi:hypothetical protein
VAFFAALYQGAGLRFLITVKDQFVGIGKSDKEFAFISEDPEES